MVFVCGGLGLGGLRSVGLGRFGLGREEKLRRHERHDQGRTGTTCTFVKKQRYIGAEDATRSRFVAFHVSVEEFRTGGLCESVAELKTLPIEFELETTPLK